MEEKTYKYKKEVLNSLGWALTQDIYPSERDQCWLKNCFIFIIKNSSYIT